LPDAGDVVVADFPGVTGTKRRPAVVLSSTLYHTVRPDIILGLITSQTTSAIEATDYVLQDWQSTNLRVPSAFRSFLVTLPSSAITATIGKLSEQDWNAVKACVRLTLADLEAPTVP
jgi:mRNA interferase MazF